MRQMRGAKVHGLNIGMSATVKVGIGNILLSNLRVLILKHRRDVDDLQMSQ